MKPSKLFAISFGLLVFMLACNYDNSTNTALNTRANNGNSGNGAPAVTTPAPTAPTVADGKEVYKKNCAICHRDTGVGGKTEIEGRRINPENLTADKFKKATDEKLEQYIREGVEDDGMPAFEDKLSDEEIKAVVRYIRTDLQKISAPSQ